MTPEEKQEWLKGHIAHRMRCSLAITPVLLARYPDVQLPSPKTAEEAIVRRCETDSIWEGRLAAMRWLIEFLGVSQDRHGQPCRPNRSKLHQKWIGDLDSGAAFDLQSADAFVLSNAWKGCTEGVSHPTHLSGHPPINDPERNAALHIIIDHLDRTIYVGTAGVLEIALQRP